VAVTQVKDVVWHGVFGRSLGFSINFCGSAGAAVDP